MSVRWLVGGTAAVRAIYAHISVENPDAARRVVRAIRDATIRLGEFPDSGRSGTVAGTRELVVPNLPYLIIYRVTGTDVEIIRVFHTATDWQAGPQ